MNSKQANRRAMVLIGKGSAIKKYPKPRGLEKHTHFIGKTDNPLGMFQILGSGLTWEEAFVDAKKAGV